MAFIIVETPDDNIWEKNPSLELISVFKDFKDSLGEEKSSNIIKAIYYIWDPKSKVKDSGVSEDTLVEDVTSSIIKDDKFNWDDYEYIKKAYIENNISKMESLLLRYEKEIIDLNTMLEGWKWSKTDIKARSEAVKAYKVLFDEYIEVASKVKAENDEIAEFFGNYQKSMLESFGQ